MLAEGLLHRVQSTVAARKALNGRDSGPVGLGSKDRAGLHALAVHQHSARPTRRRVAADVGSGKPHGLPQEIYEELASFDVVLLDVAVHGDADLHAFTPSRARHT